MTSVVEGGAQPIGDRETTVVRHGYDLVEDANDFLLPVEWLLVEALPLLHGPFLQKLHVLGHDVGRVHHHQAREIARGWRGVDVPGEAVIHHQENGGDEKSIEESNKAFAGRGGGFFVVVDEPVTSPAAPWEYSSACMVSLLGPARGARASHYRATRPRGANAFHFIASTGGRLFSQARSRSKTCQSLPPFSFR